MNPEVDPSQTPDRFSVEPQIHALSRRGQDKAVKNPGDGEAAIREAETAVLMNLPLDSQFTQLPGVQDYVDALKGKPLEGDAI